MDTQPPYENPNITNFLKANHIAVLATADKTSAAPHAATIFYATDSKMNIFFVTKENTAKNRNLTGNPQAAIAIYDGAKQETAQIFGPVSKVDDPAMMGKALRIMTKYSVATSGSEEIPISKIDAGQYVLYKLSPQSIRLAEYKYGPKNDIFDVAVPPGESLE